MASSTHGPHVDVDVEEEEGAGQTKAQEKGTRRIQEWTHAGMKTWQKDEGTD